MMKRIGMIGGMSWESAVNHNRRVNAQMGALRSGLNSAHAVLRFVNFQDIVTLQKLGVREPRADELRTIATFDFTLPHADAAVDISSMAAKAGMAETGLAAPIH